MSSEGENHRGRRCLVIGASEGIGRATADILAARGARVVYASRSEAKLQAAIKGRKHVHAVALDASDAESLRDGIAVAISKLGGLDLVVYCPGYFGADSYGSFERLFESGDWDAGWEGSINIHVKGRSGCRLHCLHCDYTSSNTCVSFRTSGMINSFRHTRKALLKSDRGGVFALQVQWDTPARRSMPFASRPPTLR